MRSTPDPAGHLLQIVKTPRARVGILYKSLPQYRKAFFERLRELLSGEDVELVLVYGQPTKGDEAKRDTVDIPWATRIRNRFFAVRGRVLIWQPALRLMRDTDLVIVEQASKLLVNYVFHFWSKVGGPRFALWGHGRAFQEHSVSQVGELLKRLTSRNVDWWFAYNELSARAVRAFGFPSERITLVQNAIDTRALRQSYLRVSPDDRRATVARLHLSGRNVCIYAGGMYEEKRLPYLLAACETIRELVPDFEMIFVGAGVDASQVASAAERHSWIRYVGPQFGDDKVQLFAVAKLFLVPGLVGLAILDSFALEVPLVTTNIPYHSPEIEYLEDGSNGLMLPDGESAAFGRAVADLLRDEPALERLKEGCRTSSEKYTVEEMAQRFASGVLRALELETVNAAV